MKSYCNLFSKIFYTIAFSLIIQVVLWAKTEVVIFHTNDIHAHVEETETAIGYAKLATLIDNERKAGKHVIFLDAGDTLHGTSIANLSKGKVIVDILNEMKLDAMVLGNHDFNYGVEQLFNLEEDAKFTILAANVIDNKGKVLFKDNIIFSYDLDRPSLKIGVFGLATPETKYKTNPKNVEFLTFLNPKVIAEKQVADLKAKKADIIIALAHLGLDESTILPERSTYLSTIKGIDIVIDGHSHTLIPSGGYHLGNTIITQTGALNQNIGKIIIVGHDDGSIEATSEIISKADVEHLLPDKSVLKIINTYKKEQNKFNGQHVTTLNIELDGERESVRFSQSNLGILIADSFRAISNSDIAVMNGGGIRTSIHQGDVKYLDILKVLPFNNIVITLEIKGSVIKNMLEHSVQNLPNSSGGLLQTSGVTFNVDIKKPAGSRVTNIKINDDTILENKTYTVTMLDFLQNGGDGYGMLKDQKIVASFDTGDKVLLDYLSKIDINNYNFVFGMKVTDN